MKISKIRNVSEKEVKVVGSNGTEISIRPGVELKNLDIANLSEIKNFVKLEYNLNEG